MIRHLLAASLLFAAPAVLAPASCATSSLAYPPELNAVLISGRVSTVQPDGEFFLVRVGTKGLKLVVTCHPAEIPGCALVRPDDFVQITGHLGMPVADEDPVPGFHNPVVVDTLHVFGATKRPG